MSTAVTNSDIAATADISKWHTDYNPVPSNLVLAKFFPDDDSCVTFAVRNNDAEKVRKYFSSGEYGLKLRSSRTMNGEKRIALLGEYPKDLCGKEYNNTNKALPPAIKAS